VPCARLSWPFCQLLSTCEYNVSYRCVLTANTTLLLRNTVYYLFILLPIYAVLYCTKLCPISTEILFVEWQGGHKASYVERFPQAEEQSQSALTNSGPPATWLLKRYVVHHTTYDVIIFYHLLFDMWLQILKQ